MRLVALLPLLGAALAVAATSAPPAARDEAERAPLAASYLLLDVATAGKRLVAVGDRGHVLLSDDQGRTWQQAERVPTRVMLTGVCFGDDSNGIAVGHDEIVLTTRDGGRNWERRRYSPETQQPLLDVACLPGAKAIAVGAYSTYLDSADGGAGWTARKFEAAPPPGAGKPAAAADDVPLDAHLNRIVARSPTQLFIAAEAGHLYRSEDAGATWRALASPYEGSFFGVLPLGGDSLLAYGLRGNAFRSDDGGSTWRRLETGTTAMLNDAVLMPDGAIAMLGLSGAFLVSRDGGATWKSSDQADRKGLQAAVVVGPGRLVAVGEGGAKVLEVPP